MQVYRGVSAFHLTAVNEGVDMVEQALLAAGMTFTRTAVTVGWPGGRGEGAEFVFVLPGTNQRPGLDLVQHLRSTGMWLLIRKVDGTTPG
ncbi:hypothetical protein [Dactylosporangium maewongense]